MRPLLLVLVSALVASACGGTVSAGGVDTAASVNGRAISTEALSALVSSQLADPQGAAIPGRIGPDQYGQVEQLQRQTLTQLIQDRIVAQSADDLGIEVTPEEVDERFEEAAQSFGGVEGLREEIARRGRTEEDVREQLAAVVRRDELQAHFQEQVELSRDELRQAYEQRLEGQYRVAETAHILVESEDRARDLLAQLDQGADFAQLAEQHSIDEASGAAGGDLGENPQGTFVEPFDDAVWSAEPGETVGPIETRFGFHIIRVIDRRTIPFSEVEDELRQELQGRRSQEAFDEWFQEQLRSADVVVASRLGEWNPETGRVEPSGSLPPVRPPAQQEQQPPAPGASPAVSPTG